MIVPLPKDAIHKAMLYRLLMKIADDAFLMDHLRFKGGTCAAMLDRLNRFSVDLDFDLLADDTLIAKIKKNLESCFKFLSLKIKDKSATGVQYFVKYAASPNQRNSIKIDTQFPPPASNRYEAVYFSEIGRTIKCHTIDTMFANKLVATLDRWERVHSMAGRDIYDIHYFFLKGYSYNKDVIEERRQTPALQLFQELIHFLETKFTNKIIQQDLNALLLSSNFQSIRKTLKIETLSLLRDELKRLK